MYIGDRVQIDSEYGQHKGQIGTIIHILSGEAYLILFSDGNAEIQNMKDVIIVDHRLEGITYE